MSELGRIVEFLQSLDNILTKKTELYIIGGGALTLAYSPDNRTSDIDVVDVDDEIVKLGGPKSDSARRYGIHISKVYDISFSVPLNWRERCRKCDFGFKNIKVFVADPYDIVLGKLARLEPKDVDDIQSLASDGHINADILIQKLNDNLKEVIRKASYRNNAVLLFAMVFNQPIIFEKGKAIKADL